MNGNTFRFYNGKTPGGLHIQLVQRELTGNMVDANRQQLNFAVPDFDEALQRSLGAGGTQVQDIQKGSDGLRAVGVQDPDGNYVVLQEFVEPQS